MGKNRLEILEEKVKAKITLINDIKAASKYLTWDQETNMPKGSSITRAEQISTLETLAHFHLVSFDTIDLANEIKDSLDSAHINDSVVLKYFIEEHEKALKIPNSFVKEFYSIRTLALDSWKNARIENRFRVFKPYLSRLVELKKAEAVNLGFSDNYYEGIIRQYEPEISIVQLDTLFNNLKKETLALMNEFRSYSDKIDNLFLMRKYVASKQITIAKFIAEKMNFDFNRGRLDVSTHPFSSCISSEDVRITVRVKENDLMECLFGTIHETGQAIYYQNIDKKYGKTFAQQPASYGLFLSQSFLWENMIGRTLEFWKWGLTHLNYLFPIQLENIDVNQFFLAINKLSPSLIRTDADYVTYNLHIILRYEIEHELFNNNLDVDDIPELWKKKMLDMFGFYPVSDTDGCLQDMQWAFGGFGIFPIYALANIYSSIIWNHIQLEIPDILRLTEVGNFYPLVYWLSQNIYKSGKTISTKSLINDVCKKDIAIDDFIDIVKKRYGYFIDSMK